MVHILAKIGDKLRRRPGRCGVDITHRDEHHRQSVCVRKSGHSGAHDAGQGCVWTGVAVQTGDSTDPCMPPDGRRLTPTGSGIKLPLRFQTPARRCTPVNEIPAHIRNRLADEIKSWADTCLSNNALSPSYFNGLDDAEQIVRDGLEKWLE